MPKQTRFKQPKMASKQPPPQSMKVKLPPELQLQIQKHIESSTQESSSPQVEDCSECAPISVKLSKLSYLHFKQYFLKTFKLSDSVVADLTGMELLPGCVTATVTFSTVSEDPNDLKLEQFASISLIIPVDML